MKIKRTSTMMHGVERRDGDGIWWYQYWRGVRHVWRWRGIPVRWRMRKRDRPMHQIIKMACGT